MHACPLSLGMRCSKLLLFLLTVYPHPFLIMPHPLRSFLPPNLPTCFFALSGVPAIPTTVHITITSLHFTSNSVLFLAIALITRATNVLTSLLVVSMCHMMLCVDEFVFPFASLHSNAGARLWSKIFLLPPSLLQSTSYGGRPVESSHMPKSIDASLQHCPLQDSS
jgi:hypothetical protein